MKSRQAVLGALAAALTLVGLTFAVPALADTPSEIPFEFVFDDVNPCTGDIHTVTIAGSTSVHSHGDRVVAVSERTITTSPTGFTGHGRDTSVDNGQVVVFRLADVLTNASGDRIRARFVMAVDLSTGTVRVETGALTCLGTA